jgi:hypothetical protein
LAALLLGALLALLSVARVAHVGSDKPLVVARRPHVDDVARLAECLERGVFMNERDARHVLPSLLGRLACNQLTELL